MLDQVMHCVFEDARLKLILVVDQHHSVLIVVVKLEARHADHSPSVFPIQPKPGCQRGFSTASTPLSTRGLGMEAKPQCKSRRGAWNCYVFLPQPIGYRSLSLFSGVKNPYRPAAVSSVNSVYPISRDFGFDGPSLSKTTICPSPLYLAILE